MLGHRQNLNTLVAAAKNGHLAIVAGTIKSTGEVVAMICAINTPSQTDDEQFEIVPFGHFCNVNPYEYYIPLTGEDADEVARGIRVAEERSESEHDESASGNNGSPESPSTGNRGNRKVN